MVWKAWVRDEQIQLLLLLSLSQTLAEHFVFQMLGFTVQQPFQPILASPSTQPPAGSMEVPSKYL